jgi:phosphatidylglycerophosphate synthase
VVTTLVRSRVGRQLAVAATALGALLGLLALVSATAAAAGWGALWPAGWIAGAGYGLALCGSVWPAGRRAGAVTLGPAGAVTLARAVLAGGVAALAAAAWWHSATGATVEPGGGQRWLLVGLATVALVLDGVDGRVARRTGTASALGARFDMETDAALILVLSGYAALLLGPWTLAIGLMRYAYVAAGWALPWLRRPLAPRYSAKVVAVIQGVVLVVVAAEVLPRPVAAGAVAVALALLTWSFGHDVRLLWHRSRAAAR